jgi:mRNA interferase RelE/StbE
VRHNKVIKKVDEITEDPFRFVKKLQDLDLYRLRVGDYRVIVSIENNEMIIFV